MNNAPILPTPIKASVPLALVLVPRVLMELTLAPPAKVVIFY